MKAWVRRAIVLVVTMAQPARERVVPARIAHQVATGQVKARSRYQDHKHRSRMKPEKLVSKS